MHNDIKISILERLGTSNLSTSSLLCILSYIIINIPFNPVFLGKVLKLIKESEIKNEI